MKKRTLVFIIVTILLLSTFSSASAQEPEGTPACVGDQVSGTVVAVDEEAGLVTIDYGDGECTVTLTTDYGHPIVTLLAAYFSEIDLETITSALEETQVCAVFDETTSTWSVVEVAEDEDCPGETVTVTGEEDGTFTATKGEGEESEDITFTIEDPAVADALTAALESLEVEWDLDEDGSVADVGDDIAAYHEDGYGFGILVKLYAIAAESPECAPSEPEAPAEEGDFFDVVDPDTEEPPCDVTVEDLMALLDSGMGLGEIFDIYGKPSLLGVGHVRADGGDGDGGGDCEGVLHARSVGGKAKAKGKDCGGGEEVEPVPDGDGE